MAGCVVLPDCRFVLTVAQDSLVLEQKTYCLFVSPFKLVDHLSVGKHEIQWGSKVIFFLLLLPFLLPVHGATEVRNPT